MSSERGDLEKPIDIYRKKGVSNKGKPLWERVGVPIVPLTDIDLAALPIGQRVDTIRERMQAYQRPALGGFTSRKTGKEIKGKFSVPLERVRPDTLALATIMEDLATKDWEKQYSQQRLEDAQRVHQERLKKIRSDVLLDRRKKERAEQAENQQWPTIKGSLTPIIEARESLSQTVLDVFIKDYLLTAAGPQKFLLAASELVLASDYQETDIISFLERVQKRLRNLHKLSDKEITFFAYKPDRYNLRTEEAARPLQQIIELAIGSTENKSRVEDILAQIGQTAVDLYWQDYKRFFPEEETPLLGFIHDYFLAATLSSDRKEFLAAANYIWPRLLKKRGQFNTQISIANWHGLQEEGQLDLELQAEYRRQQPDVSLEDFIERIGIPYLNTHSPLSPDHPYFVGLYYDRIIGLVSAFNLAEDMGRENMIKPTEVKAIKQVGELAPTVFEKLQLLRSEKLSLLWSHLLQTVFPQALTLDNTSTKLFSRPVFLKEKGQLVALAGDMPSESLSQRPSHLRYIEEALSREREHLLPLHAIEILKTNGLMHWLFVEEPMTVAKEDEIETINRQLWRKIKYENLWLVPEWGIKFTDIYDSQLQQLGIEELFFFPDAQSAGHKIIISTNAEVDGRKLKAVLYLDNQGRLLYENKAAVSLPHWIMISLNNLLLSRLEFITSAKARKKVMRPKAAGQEAILVDVVLQNIGHWRLLTSRPDTIYTLMSRNARLHAAFIQENYGKDIYEENAERRRAGTLQPGQVITFVKPVERRSPEEIGPTELIYVADQS